MNILRYKMFESKDTKKFRDVIKKLGVINKNGDIDLKNMTEKIDDFLSTDSNKKEFLKDLKEDIKPNVKVDNITIKCDKLKPSQNAIYLDNIIPRLVVKDDYREDILSGELKDRNILISSDEHIIDGHHRWAACFILNPDCKIHITQIDMPIEIALPLINAMMASDDKNDEEIENFKINIFDLIKKPKKDVFKIINNLISKTIENGAIMNDEKLKSEENWKIKEDKTRFGLKLDTTNSFYKNIKKKLNTNTHPLKLMRKNMMNIPIPKNKFSSREEMPHVKERDARSYL